jgi:hypothetical protein
MYHAKVLFYVFIPLLFLTIGCSHNRVFTNPNTKSVGVGGNNDIEVGTLVINEFEAYGSTFTNELVLAGDTSGGSDWIEIYNTTLDTIQLESGKWFVTDSLPNPHKFKLPSCSILPQQYLLVWADGFDTTISQIHSNFKLSKNGEQIGITYQKDSSTSFFVDQLTFGLQQSAHSYGRIPDGSSNWNFMSNPSPNAMNH